MGAAMSAVAVFLVLVVGVRIVWQLCVSWLRA